MTNCTTSDPHAHPLLARTRCVEGQHRWRPALVAGSMVCLVCGARGVCPGCQPLWLEPRLHLAWCPHHRQQEEGQL